jgi:hypothetical protein
MRHYDVIPVTCSDCSGDRESSSEEENAFITKPPYIGRFMRNIGAPVEGLSYIKRPKDVPLHINQQ